MSLLQNLISQVEEENSLSDSMESVERESKPKDYGWVRFPPSSKQINYIEEFLKAEGNPNPSSAQKMAPFDAPRSKTGFGAFHGLPPKKLDLESLRKEYVGTSHVLNIAEDLENRLLKYGRLDRTKDFSRKTGKNQKGKAVDPNEDYYDPSDTFIDDSMDQSFDHMVIYDQKYDDFFFYKGTTKDFVKSSYCTMRIKELNSLDRKTAQDVDKANREKKNKNKGKPAEKQENQKNKAREPEQKTQNDSAVPNEPPIKEHQAQSPSTSSMMVQEKPREPEEEKSKKGSPNQSEDEESELIYLSNRKKPEIDENSKGLNEISKGEENYEGKKKKSNKRQKEENNENEESENKKRKKTKKKDRRDEKNEGNEKKHKKKHKKRSKETKEGKGRENSIDKEEEIVKKGTKKIKETQESGEIKPIQFENEEGKEADSKGKNSKMLIEGGTSK